LREKGVHIWEHRPCFFTLAHSKEDIAQVIEAFKVSVAELQAAGFLPVSEHKSPSLLGEKIAPSRELTAKTKLQRNQPPIPGARLGRDPEGNPAWYIPDANRPGKYVQVEAIIASTL
jgi:hypothetical protein